MDSMLLSPATRTCSKLPASIILSPRELKQYRRWQRLYTILKPAEQGFLPTASEYDEFQQWFKKQDSGYFSDVFEDIAEHIKPLHPSSAKTDSGLPIASFCGHEMHPVAADYSCLRCPICTIDMHLNYMNLLTRTFLNANGRPLPRTGTPSKNQEDLYYAWSQEKIAIMRQVSTLEIIAVKESEWSLKHPEAQFPDLKTAAKALDLYWSELDGCHTTERRKNQKTVAFANDTNFSPGRPVQDFLRGSPRYEPGKYTVRQEGPEGDDDISEDSEDYTRGTIYVMSGSEETDEYKHDVMLARERQVEVLCSEAEYDDESEWEDIDSDVDDDEDLDVCRMAISQSGDDTDFIIFDEN